jgi:prepilin-type N-terminal cleavage/methylation domain-containing protein
MPISLSNTPRKPRFSARASSGCKAGFSLLELMIVMAVALTLTYLSVPALVSMSQAGNFGSNTTELSDLLEQAYSTALSRNTYVWIGFSQLSQNRGGVAVASVYSAHENPGDFPNNVSALTKPVILQNVNLGNVTSQITNPNRATTSVCQITAANLGSFSVQVAGSSQTMTYVLQISPTGQLSASSTNKYAWMEIDLTPLNASAKNAAVLQMNSFTGRVFTFRP